MKKILLKLLLLVSFIISGTAIAAEFPNNASVNIPGLGNFTLLKKGMDNNGAIYELKHSSNKYLMAASGNEGEKVQFGSTPTQWVLHKNSTGWSIIAAANEANTVARVDNGKGGKEWVLQRNQGRPNQVWQIRQ